MLVFTNINAEIFRHVEFEAHSPAMIGSGRNVGEAQWVERVLVGIAAPCSAPIRSLIEDAELMGDIPSPVGCTANGNTQDAGSRRIQASETGAEHG